VTLARDFLSPELNVKVLFLHRTCSVATSLLRDASRPEGKQVGQQTIQKISDTLEVPGTGGLSWEVEGNVLPFSGNFDSGVAAFLVTFDGRATSSGAAPWSDLCPAESPVDELAIQAARLQTSESVKHSADITLRGFVKCACELDKSLGKVANTARKAVLLKVKEDGVGRGLKDLFLEGLVGSGVAESTVRGVAAKIDEQ